MCLYLQLCFTISKFFLGFNDHANLKISGDWSVQVCKCEQRHVRFEVNAAVSN